MTTLVNTQIHPIGDGEAEQQMACGNCGHPQGHIVMANGQTEGEQMGEVHSDCTPDDGQVCENCGETFSHSVNEQDVVRRSKMTGRGRR